jgi:hypothetical protein
MEKELESIRREAELQEFREKWRHAMASDKPQRLRSTKSSRKSEACRVRHTEVLPAAPNALFGTDPVKGETQTALPRATRAGNRLPL